MDAGLIIGGATAVFMVGTSIVSIAVYTSRTRAITEATDKDLKETAHRVRNLDHWRLNVLPVELNTNFARKETMAVELRAIHESLERIEEGMKRLGGVS